MEIPAQTRSCFVRRLSRVLNFIRRSSALLSWIFPGGINVEGDWRRTPGTARQVSLSISLPDVLVQNAQENPQKFPTPAVFEHRFSDRCWAFFHQCRAEPNRQVGRCVTISKTDKLGLTLAAGVNDRSTSGGNCETESELRKTKRALRRVNLQLQFQGDPAGARYAGESQRMSPVCSNLS